MTKQIKIIVFKKTIYSTPSKPTEFMDFWQEKIDLIPIEFIDNAKIDVFPETFYEGASIQVEISYIRNETDKEKALRMEREEGKRRHFEDQELSLYKELSKKYGVKSEKY